MNQIPYINYKELDEFYTVQQLASLFGMTKQELKEACKKYDIEPRQNEVSEYGFVRYDVRRLHNFLYYESRGGKKDDGYHKEDDPWA